MSDSHNDSGPRTVDDADNRDAMLAELASSTERLLATVDSLTDEDIGRASLLLGWTRGHVLAHVARNADGLRNLVTWANTGAHTPMYASRERRDAEISRDALRPVAEHRADASATADALARDLRALPADRMDTVVRTQPGREFPARQIAWRRLREVEIHHVDLGSGYTAARWPAPFVARCLGDITDMFAATTATPPMTLQATESARTWRLGDAEAVTGAPTVSGPERALLAWLIGRGDGAELTVTPTGQLPQPPAWA